jgi:hypothetical protein
MAYQYDYSPEMRDEEAIVDKFEYDHGALDTPATRRLHAEDSARRARINQGCAKALEKNVKNLLTDK